VDGYSFDEEDDDHQKYSSQHHAKHPSEYPTKQDPKLLSSKSKPAHGQQPPAPVSPAKFRPLPDSGTSYPYTKLAYPTTPAYPAKPAYPVNLDYTANPV
jgi:hypothetical protein